MVGHRLLHRLRHRGLLLTLEGRADIRVSPKSKLRDADRRAIVQHKDELIAALIDESPNKGTQRTEPVRPGAVGKSAAPFVELRFGDAVVAAWRYRPKMGQVFDGRFALDCETELIRGHRPPRLALVAVSDGKQHYLIHPDDLAAFIVAHADLHVVFHHAAFDFWVVHRHLIRQKKHDALVAWMGLLRHRRLHDTMLLDMLVRLALDSSNSEELPPRDLGEVSGEHLGIALDKENPYRKRFGELIGADWANVEPGFFKYAAPDAVATVRVYTKLRRRARELMFRHGFDDKKQTLFSVDPKAIGKFGVLTESVQVAGAVALARVSQHGMATDQERLQQTAGSYRATLNKLVRSLHRNYPELFKLDSAGKFKLTKTGAPSRSDTVLNQYLCQALEQVSKKRGKPIDVPRKANGHVSTKQELWAGFRGDAPFVRLWLEYQETAKLSQFLDKLDKPVIRPEYKVLKRTGRTGCSSPNIQQVPRKDEFREVVVPSNGHLLLTIDYKFIELVTLAAACRCRFGKSRLGEVIGEGVDPHCYTAAMLLGKKYKSFMKLKDTAPADFKHWRQLAKPVNFGVPGGLVPQTLVDYARGTFFVDMTLEEATEFRRCLVEDVYPELHLFLAETLAEDLALALRTSVDQLRVVINRDPESFTIVVKSLRKLVAGRPYKVNGTPYNDRYVDDLWDILNQVNRNEQLVPALGARQGSDVLARALFPSSVATLTGRIRTGVPYTTQRNTQFQGLAADGAKIALSRLTVAGYRVVGFVHDEILVELPDAGRGFVQAAEVDKVVDLVRDGMAEVTYGYPVECEYTVACCWSKRAELIRKGKRVYAWRPP